MATPAADESDAPPSPPEERSANPLELGPSPLLSTFRWTEAMTRQFIQIRIKRNAIFTGKRNSSIAGWNHILEEMGLLGCVTAEQARKRWTNMCQKYKELRAQVVEKSTSGEAVATPTWSYYADIDSYFRMMGDPSAGAAPNVEATPQPAPSVDPFVGVDAAGFKRKRSTEFESCDYDVGPESEPRHLQLHEQAQQAGDSTENGVEDPVIRLLHRSLDSIQSLQETLKYQGEAMIALLQELVHKS